MVRKLDWAHLVPLKIQEIAVRRSLQLPTDEFMADVEVKLADTHEEILGAFRLIYESYAATGLCDTDATALRITKYALAPTTGIVIMKKAGQIIATVSAVLDGPLGLPLESLWSLDRLRHQGIVIAELSNLAVHTHYKHGRGRTILPLFFYSALYAEQCLGAQAFVCSTHPRAEAFYSGLFGFKRFGNGVRALDTVKGAPALGMYRHFYEPSNIFEATAGVRLGKGADRRPLSDMLERYMTQHFRFPKRDYYQGFDANLRLETLWEIFASKIKSLDTLTQLDRELLIAAYHYPEYEQAMAASSSTGAAARAKQRLLKHLRAEPRFRMHCQGRLFTSNAREPLSSIRILDLSRGGLQFYCADSSFPVGHKLIIETEVGPNKILDLEVIVLRQKGHYVGAQISRSGNPQSWQDLIAHLEGQLHPNIATAASHIAA